MVKDVDEGIIAEAPGTVDRFGSVPLFFYPSLGQTSAELTEAEKAALRHSARDRRRQRPPGGPDDILGTDSLRRAPIGGAA